MTRQTSATFLPWAISSSAVLSLQMICSVVCLVRFMVESPPQSGRLRTYIHPGPGPGVHVRCWRARQGLPKQTFRMVCYGGAGRMPPPPRDTTMPLSLNIVLYSYEQLLPQSWRTASNKRIGICAYANTLMQYAFISLHSQNTPR